ncbi:MAG: hypothetical protein P8Y45_15740 [Exilibacterium sp.]
MSKEEIFNIIKRKLLEILPNLDESRIEPLKSMKDLGANSIDRVDVIIETMEEMKLVLSPHEVGPVENIQGLVDFLYARCPRYDA